MPTNQGDRLVEGQVPVLPVRGMHFEDAVGGGGCPSFVASRWSSSASAPSPPPMSCTSNTPSRSVCPGYTGPCPAPAVIPENAGPAPQVGAVGHALNDLEVGVALAHTRYVELNADPLHPSEEHGTVC